MTQATLRSKLISTLRNLPTDFEWNYNDNTKCALGVYRKFIQEPGSPLEDWATIGEKLGLETETAGNVFFNQPCHSTPKDIALLLESL